MTINKTLGDTLSFKDDIEAEFGGNPARSLGSYRITQSVGELSNLPLDDGVPTSGEIKFSDFYGKKLNIVVNCFSTDANNGGAEEERVDAKTDKWNNNKIVVVGGFKSKKENGSKIIIHVNKKICSDKVNINRCALKTGSWPASSTVQVDVGSSAQLLGSGGNGGTGATGNSAGGAGGDGTSGLGIEANNCTVNVVSGGIIRAGFGGGGGGGGGRQVDKGEDRKSSGGGGGGGQGCPGGNKGAPGGSGNNTIAASDNATAGDESEAGEGGTANENAGETIGGSGGEGGSFGEAANQGNNSSQAGGAGGADGAAIRRVSGYNVTINNNGTIQGGTNATGVA